MATTIKTRILNRIDLYENWITNNPTPLNGEICIVVVPAETGAVVQEPATLIKVGDGTTPFADLPYLSAVAGDVHDWAKAANKPGYNAGEIAGIDAYIANYVNEQMGISVDTDTLYQMVKVDAYTYKLQSKGKTDETWVDVDGGEISIPAYDDAALISRIGALETLVGSETVAAQIAAQIAALELANTYEVKGTAEAKIAELNLPGTYEAKGAAAAVDAKLTAEVTRASEAEAALSARIVPVETFMAAAELDGEGSSVIDTLKEIQEYIKSDETGAAEMLAAINKNSVDVETILNDYLTSEDRYDDSSLIARIEASEGEIDALQAASASQAGLISALQSQMATKVTAEEGKSLISDALIAKLEGMNADGEANVLVGIQVAGVDVAIDESKKANITVASAGKAGVVKSSAAENGVSVAGDGTMFVNNISISKLTQGEDEELILSGGSSL